jgi:CubicO group peptidase (beta-lactamase class C family)
MRLAAACFLATLTTALASADRIDDIVRQEMSLQGIPGVSLVVRKDGRVIKAKGYGYSNLETMTKATPDTEYQTGSDGKMYTATALLQLVQKGALNLDDPVSNHLKVPDAWKGITVRNLLNHTGGLMDYLTADAFDPAKDYTLDSTLAMVASQPLDFQPGASWSYSNTGYIAVGRIVELMNGLNYDNAMRQLVFKPAGLEHSYVNNPSYLIPNRANGYLKDAQGKPLNAQNWSQTLMQFPDGAFVQTAGDLAKFADALYAGTLINKAMLGEMWSPAKLANGRLRGYGMGWFLPIYPGHQVYEHGGNMIGFNAEIWKDLTSGVTIAVCVNEDGTEAVRIAHRIAREALPETKPEKGAAPAPTTEVDKMIRAELDQFLQGKLDEANLTSDFALATATARGKASMAGGKALGVLQSLTYLESDAGLGEVMHVYQLKTDKGTSRVNFNIYQGKLGGISAEKLPPA